MNNETLFARATHYWDVLDEQGADALSNEQHTLLAFCYLDSQVQEGGFVQLIASGLGDYVLLNPVADSLRRWRIKSTPKVLEKAKVLYQQHGEQIEHLAEQGETVAALRAQFPMFEDLDADYYECADDDWALACDYVAAHLDLFPE